MKSIFLIFLYFISLQCLSNFKDDTQSNSNKTNDSFEILYNNGISTFIKNNDTIAQEVYPNFLFRTS